VRGWALALALVLACAGAASAQGAANVQVGKVRLGFLDELDAGWVAVSVPLDNTGSETRVRLVATASANADLWTSEKTVTLAPRAHRVETLYVRAADNVNQLKIQVLVGATQIHESHRGLTFRATSWRAARHEPPVPLHALLVRDGPREAS
jgi:hypothetical protein